MTIYSRLILHSTVQATMHLILIVKKKDVDFVEKDDEAFKENGVEFRRGSAGGGNQLSQPYLKKYVEEVEFEKFPVTEHIHFFGFYLGKLP